MRKIIFDIETKNIFADTGSDKSYKQGLLKMYQKITK